MMDKERRRHIEWSLVAELWFVVMGYTWAAAIGFGPAMIIGMAISGDAGVAFWTGLACAVIAALVMHRKIWR